MQQAPQLSQAAQASQIRSTNDSSAYLDPGRKRGGEVGPLELEYRLYIINIK